MEVVIVAPDAEVNAGAFHRGGDLGERRGTQRNRRGKTKRVRGAIRRHVGEGNGGRHPLFTLEARPERRVDEGLDGHIGGSFRQIVATPLPGGAEVAGEVRLHLGSDNVGGGIGGLRHAPRRIARGAVPSAHLAGGRRRGESAREPGPGRLIGGRRGRLRFADRLPGFGQARGQAQ